MTDPGSVAETVPLDDDATGEPRSSDATSPSAAPAGGATAGPAPAEPRAPGAAGAGLTMFELARLEEARRRAAEVERKVRDSGGGVKAALRRPSRLLAATATVAILAAALAVWRPGSNPYELDMGPLVREVGKGAEVVSDVPVAAPSRPAFGKSGAVLVRVAMPGQVIDYPLELQRAAAGLRYQWVRAADSSQADDVRPLGGTAVVAPVRAGLYHLSLLSPERPAHDAAGVAAPGGRLPPERRVLDGITVAVLVPFAQKLGGTINGYRIGSYPFEHFGGERPIGFVEVDRRSASLPITSHLRLSDFLTHDEQQQWPRYVAVSPRLLDKVELVVTELARLRGRRDPLSLRVSVHSGFRTPLHNQSVEGSALNSRHQYGDAADIAIDADGDGRYSAFDSRLVALAVELVEKQHPEFVGGLGIYISPRYRTPYVHIDARGRRARWWG